VSYQIHNHSSTKSKKNQNQSNEDDNHMGAAEIHGNIGTWSNTGLLIPTILAIPV